MFGIRLSNGHELKYVIASGGLAYDGKGWLWDQPLRWLNLLDEQLFTTIIKSLTLPPREGNFRWYYPLGCVRYLRGGGIVNAFDLTNPGIDWWCRNVGPKIDSKKASLVGSSVTIPVHQSRLQLGTWQGIYFCEFDGPRQRRVVITLITQGC